MTSDKLNKNNCLDESHTTYYIYCKIRDYDQERFKWNLFFLQSDKITENAPLFFEQLFVNILYRRFIHSCLAHILIYHLRSYPRIHPWQCLLNHYFLLLPLVFTEISPVLSYPEYFIFLVQQCRSAI